MTAHKSNQLLNGRVDFASNMNIRQDTFILSFLLSYIVINYKKQSGIVI